MPWIPGGDARRSSCSVSAALLVALLWPVAAAAEQAPTSDPIGADLLKMRQELEAQRAELEAQRAELEAQRAELDAAVNPPPAEALEAVDPPLRFYGWADMGVQRLFMADTFGGQSIIPSDATTFVVGNLNLYMDARPIEDWQALVEVRLLTYPHGSDAPGNPGKPYARTSTSVFDVNNGGGGWARLEWGSILLERAHIDWTGRDWLKVRAGLFLTPWGIWNVDHGTPTLISMMLPQFIINQMIPIRQVGLQLYGDVIAGAWHLGYQAYVSNGRTPGQHDLTDDKMLGGRVTLARTVPFPLRLGLSGLLGRYSDKTRTLTSVEPVMIERKEVIAYGERTLGADVSLDLGPFRLRCEGLVRSISYDEGKRAQVFEGLNNVFWADTIQWDAYLLTSYRLPWWGLEPYAYLEVLRLPTVLGEGLLYPSVGLNIRFRPTAMLKLQYMYGVGLDFPLDLRRDQEHQMVAARLVLAF